MTAPTRRPRGTQAGGQFAPDINPESTVDLGVIDVASHYLYEDVNHPGRMTLVPEKTERHAIVRENGDKEWLSGDVLDREDGPAIEHADGSISWYRDGEHILTMTPVDLSQ